MDLHPHSAVLAGVLKSSFMLGIGAMSTDCPVICWHLSRALSIGIMLGVAGQALVINKRANTYLNFGFAMSDASFGLLPLCS